MDGLKHLDKYGKPCDCMLKPGEKQRITVEELLEMVKSGSLWQNN